MVLACVARAPQVGETICHPNLGNWTMMRCAKPDSADTRNVLLTLRNLDTGEIAWDWPARMPLPDWELVPGFDGQD